MSFIRVEDIQRATAAYYNIPLSSMLSECRAHRFSHPRQVAMLLARELTGHSLPDIGRRFGGRDHTTVLYAPQAVRRRIADGSKEALDLFNLRETLLQAAPHNLNNRVRAELAAARFLEHVASLS